MENNKDNKELLIEAKKELNELVLNAKKKARETKCLLCGKECSTLVSSHSIPRYILNSISNNGYLYNPTAINDDTGFIIDEKFGLKKAGTFHLICNECDKSFFKCYEEYNEIYDLFNKIKNHKIDFTVHIKLASIYLKSILKEYHTKKIDVHVHEHFKEIFLQLGIYDEYNMSEIAELNIEDYKIDIEYCQSVINNVPGKTMAIIDYIELEYTVPFATQAVIALQKDIKGKMINDVFNMSHDYHISELAICVFPINGKTHIIIFTVGKNKGIYSEFISQYKRLSKQDRLRLIQVLIFSHTEEIYIDDYLYELFKKDNIISSCIAEGIGISTTKQIGPFEIDLGGEVKIESYKNIKICYFDRKFSKEYRHSCMLN